MSIRKQFLKTRPVCKVTFKLPENIAKQADCAHVVGEFNNWSTSATPMRRLKNGGFSTTMELRIGQSYQFRYLLGQSHWANDPGADGAMPTPFGDGHNSVIRI